MNQPVLRPMTTDDVPAAEQLSDEAFLALERRRLRADQPEPSTRAPEHRASWTARTRRLVTADGACWVLEEDDGSGRLLGMATSLRRESLWVLATYAVRPESAGRGLGKRLLDAALGHADGCSRAMLSSSADPAASRRYLLAGFELHPQLQLSGVVDRSALPAVRGVRDGVAADRPLLDALDRERRGASHGADHDAMATENRLLVQDDAAGRGYAYVTPTGRLRLLAASDEGTASRLLWTVLADADPGAEVSVPHLTAANQWALRVGVAARLHLDQGGYLGVRGLAPPAPYVHDGALL